MATLIASQSGDWDTATTWDTLMAEINPNASGSVTANTSFTAISNTHTAINTTNAITGVVALVNTYGNQASTLTARLQENTGSWTTVAEGTLSLEAIRAFPSTYLYIRFSTPYVPTATTANRYRVIFGTESSSMTLAPQNGGTTLVATALSYDVHSVPGSGDSVNIIGIDNTETVVTQSGTASFGNSGMTTNASNLRNTVNAALIISSFGVLDIDPTTDNTFNIFGTICSAPAGLLRLGTPENPQESGTKTEFIFDSTGLAASAHHGVYMMGGGDIALQGQPTDFKTFYTSGTGTAADPLIVADEMDWQVGDRIGIPPGTQGATNYLETEYRYIITRNSGTSFVLSNTSGGSESALVYTKTTDTRIIKLNTNVIVRGQSSSNSMNFLLASQGVVGQTDIDFVTFQNWGSTASGATTQVGHRVALDNVIFDGSISDSIGRYGVTFIGTLATTFSNIISCGLSGNVSNANGCAFVFNSAKNQTLRNSIAFGRPGSPGVGLSGAYGNTLTNIEVAGCGSSTTTTGAFFLVNSGNNTMTNVKIDASRSTGVGMSAATANTFNNSRFGLFSNGTDVVNANLTFNTALFMRCNFYSPNLIHANYLQQLAGSSINFHAMNSNDLDHRWFTPNGVGRSTGAGLEDTTVRTPDSLALRINPQSEDGFNYRFNILARANSAVSVSGFVKLNSNYIGNLNTSAVISMTLPGSDEPDAVQVLSKDNDDWQLFSLSANYTGDIDAYTQITLNVSNPDVIADGFAYVDDIYNGTNKITAMDVWYEGQPSPIMFEQLGDPIAIANAVWDLDMASNQNAGSTGKQLASALTTGKFLGLK